MIRKLLDKFPGSTQGSRIRNLFSYWALFCIGVLSCEAIFEPLTGPFIKASWAGPFFSIAAVTYFIIVVVGVIFVVSKKAGIDSLRLARDGMISIVLTILAFSIWYRHLGITLETSCTAVTPSASIGDSIYFSAVTFSTLGYGDFRPCQNARLIAALQAIIGNLHLGLIVGTAFFFAQDAGSKRQ